MPVQTCAEVWAASETLSKAKNICTFAPSCSCEMHSLVDSNLPGIPSDEFIARILVTPSHYNLDTGEVLRAKLTAVSSSGLSIVRQHASADEIRGTVAELENGGAEKQDFVGAVVARAAEIRSIGDSERWFCVYHTETNGKKQHGDIVGWAEAASNSAQKKLLRQRRQKLQDLLNNNVWLEETVDDFIARFSGL